MLAWVKPPHASQGLLYLTSCRALLAQHNAFKIQCPPVCLWLVSFYLCVIFRCRTTRLFAYPFASRRAFESSPARASLCADLCVRCPGLMPWGGTATRELGVLSRSVVQRLDVSNKQLSKTPKHGRKVLLDGKVHFQTWKQPEHEKWGSEGPVTKPLGVFIPICCGRLLRVGFPD